MLMLRNIACHLQLGIPSGLGILPSCLPSFPASFAPSFSPYFSFILSASFFAFLSCPVLSFPSLPFRFCPLPFLIEGQFFKVWTVGRGGGGDGANECKTWLKLSLLHFEEKKRWLAASTHVQTTVNTVKPCSFADESYNYKRRDVLRIIGGGGGGGIDQASRIETHIPPVLAVRRERALGRTTTNCSKPIGLYSGIVGSRYSQV